MKSPVDRRQFLATATATGAALSLASTAAAKETPALLGGTPVRREPFPGWPRVDDRDEKALVEVLRSGRWYRGSGDVVNQFESAYAELTGAKHCVAVANGTSSLITTLAALGVGPGDEVIVPPYTFIATVAIMPVHLGGSVADLDAILEVARKHKLPVVEDACQSHLAEWRNRKVGTWGSAGGFSFQNSKNLTSGEGGAILTNDGELAERCYKFQNNSGGRQGTGDHFSTLGGRGANLRLTEFQGALLMSQMTRLEHQSRTREQNARYLTTLLEEIPGISPAKMYEGCTRNAYHLYMFRFDGEALEGLPRAKFLKALAAEGIPASGGYSPLNKQSFLREALASKGFKRLYAKDVLEGWEDRNQCPANDRLCEEAVWFTQNMLLGDREDMEQIAAAVRKIQAHAGSLARA